MNTAFSLPTPRPSLPPEAGARWSHWIPIRSLAEAHRGRIHRHLVALPPSDRYLRFGYAASDEQIARYIDSIDFARDEVFGIYNRKLTLIAVAHLAFGQPSQWPEKPERPAMVEFGVSVLPQARGRGFGKRLFEHALIRARNRHTDTLFIHALTENTVMLKIARHAGATVERDGADARAWLNLPPDTLASQAEQVIERRAGEVDYHLKRHAHRLQRWAAIAREIRHQLQRRTGAHAVHRDE